MLSLWDILRIFVALSNLLLKNQPPPQKPSTLTGYNDLLGHHLSSSRQRINIVKISDGSKRKVTK